MAEMDEKVRAFFAAMGKKGGSVRGESKRRGDREYYSALAAKRAKKSDKPPAGN